MISNVFDELNEFKNSVFLYIKGTIVNVVLTDEQMKLHKSGERLFEDLFVHLPNQPPAKMLDIIMHCDAVFFITGNVLKCRGDIVADKIREFLSATPSHKVKLGYITTDIDNVRTEFNKIINIISRAFELHKQTTGK